MTNVKDKRKEKVSVATEVRLTPHVLHNYVQLIWTVFFHNHHVFYSITVYGHVSKYTFIYCKFYVVDWPFGGAAETLSGQPGESRV